MLTRYSIENFLLDPILIYACLLEKNLHGDVLELEELADCNVHSLAGLPNEELQEIADQIFAKIETFRPQLKSENSFQVTYCNGNAISAPIWLQEKRGHDLSTIVRECFRCGDKFPITKKLEEPLLMLTAKLPGFITTDIVALYNGLSANIK